MNQAIIVASLAAAYLLGSCPMSQIVARVRASSDLRRVGSGSVSPMNLRTVAGVAPALVAGALEVAKGAGAVALLLGHGPWAMAVAGFLAVAGHNWSPFLRGAGGRGLSTATGALLVSCWPAAAVMCAGLALGTVVRRQIAAMGVALFALVPVVVVLRGPAAAVQVAIVAAPIGAKTATLKYSKRRRVAPATDSGGS